MRSASLFCGKAVLELSKAQCNNTDINNTDINNTDYSDTDPFLSSNFPERNTTGLDK